MDLPPCQIGFTAHCSAWGLRKAQGLRHLFKKKKKKSTNQEYFQRPECRIGWATPLICNFPSCLVPFIKKQQPKNKKQKNSSSNSSNGTLFVNRDMPNLRPSVQQTGYRGWTLNGKPALSLCCVNGRRLSRNAEALDVDAPPQISCTLSPRHHSKYLC